RAVHRVPARRISAVGPINEPLLQIELEIDRLRQTIEYYFYVGAISRRLAFRDVDVRAKDAALASVRWPFLRPVKFPAIWINGDADTPFGQVGPRTRVAFAGVDQRLDIRTIQVRAHHAHSLAVAPIEFTALLFQMELLRRKGL